MVDVEPKIGGFNPPKWMVKIMVPNPIFLMDDLGGNFFTPILGLTPWWSICVPSRSQLKYDWNDWTEILTKDWWFPILGEMIEG